jgi:pyruvate kinase
VATYLKLSDHKTKIVCTIGPASRSKAVVEKMIRNGMNVARLNLSHGTHDEHRADIKIIRSAAERLKRDITIMMDLPGPKIRIGQLQSEPLLLVKGQQLVLTTENVAVSDSVIPVNYKRLPESVRRGNIIYLNDGFIQLRVLDTDSSRVTCRVILGGRLLSFKGLNLPNAKIFLEPITRKDLMHLDFGLKEGIDTFGISFVEKAADILKVKKYAARKGRPINVIAKIERAEAVRNIDEILAVTDGLMVARGDLGVQVPLEEVPGIQKNLIRQANIMGRPVITATQMLESMVGNIRPTRAEVTDVANAILDGTDAVMLSEETAIGGHPAETVKMMARIAASIEQRQSIMPPPSDLVERYTNDCSLKKLTVEDVVSSSVIEACRALDARLVLTPTMTGSTPRRISRFKPPCWIISFSSCERTNRLLALSYGVFPFPGDVNTKDKAGLVEKLKSELKLIKKGDRVVVTEGSAAGTTGGTDSFRIITVT